MKKSLKKHFIFACLLFFIPLLLHAANIDTVVSTEWLTQNLSNPKLTVIDIRKAEDYKENHISNSVNVPAKSWITKKKDMLNEVLSDDDVKDLIIDAGIGQDSMVVIAGTVTTPLDIVSAARAAWTLKYAGVKDVSILNGGMEKWVREGKPLTKTIVKPKAKPFAAKFNRAIYAAKDLSLIHI